MSIDKFEKKLSNRDLKNRNPSRNGIVCGPIFPKESETLKSAPENIGVNMSNHMYRVRFLNFLKNFLRN